MNWPTCDRCGMAVQTPEGAIAISTRDAERAEEATRSALPKCNHIQVLQSGYGGTNPAFPTMPTIQWTPTGLTPRGKPWTSHCT